jgi:hypothetical protein
VKYIFANGEDVAKGSAFCERAGKMVSTHELFVDLLVAGFPCKDLSSLKQEPCSMFDPSGPTGSALCALLKFICRTSPSAVLFENVMGILHLKRFETERPWDLLHKRMKKAGFIGGYLPMNASSYGLPQSRPCSQNIVSRRVSASIHFLARQSWWISAPMHFRVKQVDAESVHPCTCTPMHLHCRPSLF